MLHRHDGNITRGYIYITGLFLMLRKSHIHHMNNIHTVYSFIMHWLYNVITKKTKQKKLNSFSRWLSMTLGFTKSYRFSVTHLHISFTVRLTELGTQALFTSHQMETKLFARSTVGHSHSPLFNKILYVYTLKHVQTLQVISFIQPLHFITAQISSVF